MAKKLKKVSSSKKVKKVSKKKFNFNNPLISKIIGLIFISLALLIIIFPYSKLTQKSSENNPIAISPKLLEQKKLDNIPIRVIIPKSDIDLKVIPSRVVNGYWELSENTASYGLGSGMPGEKSNTVIFAHAREGLFYNLKDVRDGDTIYVFTKNKWYRYKVNKITAVYPNDVKVIQPTKNETLTLYTCTGFNDEKRLIVTATPNN